MMDNQTATLSSVEVLIDAVGRGSQVALKRLYEIESRRLYGIALRIVRRPEIAAEVLQETFVQIWQNAAAFSNERGAGASSAFARSMRSARLAARSHRTILCSATRQLSQM